MSGMSSQTEDSEVPPILNALFQGSLSEQEAARHIVPIMLQGNLDVSFDETWIEILSAAKKSPQYQDKLVSLLVELQKQPLVRYGDTVLKVQGMTVWEDLPGLGRAFNSEWNHLSIPRAGSKRQETIDQFVNLNTFSARLMRLEPPIVHLHMEGLFTMESALETPGDRMRDAQEPPDMWVAAAAAWFLTVGNLMYEWDIEYQQGPGSFPGCGGPLWRGGKAGYCRERWGLWRKRLGELAGSDLLSEEIKQQARRAENRMREIEAGVS